MDSQTKESLSDVLIQIIDSDKFTTTDEDGNFIFENICSKSIKSKISRYGYYDTLVQTDVNYIIIYLNQETFQLNSVLILDQKEKNIGTKTISQRSISINDRPTNPTQSLADFISEIDGVTLTSVGSNVQLPVIHGLYGNRILILNNYLKHGFQNWGNEHAPEINISSVDKVTVIKGSSGVRFGPEALGGAVIIEPDPMKLNSPFYLNLGSGFQTNGKGMNFNVKSGSGYKNFGYSLGLDYSKIGDRHAPSYSLTNTGKEEKSLNLGFHYHIKSFDIKLFYNYVDLDLALLRSSFFHSGNALSNAINSETPLFIRPFSYNINEPNQVVSHHFSKAKINWWYNENEKVSFTFGGQLNSRKEYDVRRNSHKPIIDLDLYTFDYLLEWEHSLSKNLNGLIGFQFFNQDNDNNPGTGTTAFIPNYNTNRWSLFVLETKKIGKNFIEAGIRLDNEINNVRGRVQNQNIFRDEYKLNNITLSLGFENKISQNFSIKSNLGSAWRTPNMAELFSYGGHSFKNTFGLLRYYYNSSDKIMTDKVIKMDEAIITAEKGIKFINELNFNSEKQKVKITLFSNYIMNYIFERPIGLFGTIRGPMPYFIYDQTDIIFIGSDISLERKITENIKSTSTLNYLWSKNLNKNGKLINQPPIKISNNFVIKTNKFWNINFSEVSILPSYTFKQFQVPKTISPEQFTDGSLTTIDYSEVFDIKDAPDGYFLFNLTWKIKKNNLSTSLIIKNLFNKKYRNYLNQMRYFADEPGRNFVINFSYLFKKND
jgi:iron complex outermembrane receptor protein